MENTFRDILRVEGINAKGFGIIPKIVMLDKRLTIEAKAIYSYFRSYAGAGSTAFPKVEKVCLDLDISEKRYYKHFNMLKACGYIKTEQATSKNNKFSHNVYTLCENPVPEVQKEPSSRFDGTEGLPSSQNDGTEKPSGSFAGTQNRSTQNDGSKSNRSYIKNNNNNKISQSVYNDAENGEKDKGTDIPTDKSISEKDEKDNNAIDEVNEIIEKSEVNIYHEPAKTLLIDCIQNIYFDSNFAKRIGIPQEIIRSRLHRLNHNIIDRALYKYQEAIENETEIKSPQNYFMKCLWSALTESQADCLQVTG